MFDALGGRRHLPALIVLTLVATLLWCEVLFTSRVLLPGALLQGFAPFGQNPNAPWTILQWDALAQYYPWRQFAARELAAGRIPLWNPHQFAGAPFVANGQSAVFYPLNFPFWIFETARAFGIAAWLHSLLALWGAYFLGVRWQVSRLASIFASVAFGVGGYLVAWSALPTLSETASWLPLLILLFERAVVPCKYLQRKISWSRVAWFGAALACALLAGHAQIWLFLVFALTLRAVTLWHRNALQVLAGGLCWALGLSALQWLPMLELARLGHRAAQGGPSSEGWKFVSSNALQIGDWPSLFFPNWPHLSWSENFAYQGATVCALAIIGAMGVFRRRDFRSPQSFALLLTVCGLVYALALPPTSLAYFHVPGWSQLAGLGRALMWFSLGAAFLAAFGLDALRAFLMARKTSARTCTLVAACLIGAASLELGFNAFGSRITSPRESIYPNTALTNWLQANVKPSERIAFITPRQQWLPSEFLARNGRVHPPGVLPPSGAMVYGLNDVGGYDSLAPLKYRQFLNSGETGATGVDVGAVFNGNMLLPSANNRQFAALGVRYVVTLDDGQNVEDAQSVWRGDGAQVWRREEKNGVIRSGGDFTPGWRGGQYQPQSFRLGTWLSLCALAVFCCTQIAASTCRRRKGKN